jgi:excisionase family DNA binding protein
LREGRAVRHTHDDKRHGVVDLGTRRRSPSIRPIDWYRFAHRLLRRCYGGSAPNSKVGTAVGGDETLLAAREVARRLGVSTATVYALCDRGELAHVRVANAIRIAPADFEEFVRARRRAHRGKGA